MPGEMPGIFFALYLHATPAKRETLLYSPCLGLLRIAHLTP
jgi:hypothetical protein